MPSSQTEKRVQGIDVLRGLCIVAVVLHHINLRIRFQNCSLGKLLSPAAHRVLFWNGYYGVIVFFVISGFLITTWSLKRWGALQQVNQRQFYVMRFARIMPCLLALLATLSILHLAHTPQFVINPQRSSLPRALLAALTFHVNWLESRVGYLPASWDVLWSLSIEEMFYLFFPLVCFWTRKQWVLISVLASFVVIGPFARTVFTHNQYWSDNGYLSCMDGIALGCLAAILAHKIQLSHRASIVLGLAGTSLCIFITVFRATAGLLGIYKVGLEVTLLELGTAMLVIAIQQRFETRPASGHWSTAMLRWYGRNSYEVYLTHMFVIWPMVGIFYHSRQPLNSALLWFLAMTALSGVLGYLVARFYSEPLNRIVRTKFLPAAPHSRVASVTGSA